MRSYLSTIVDRKYVALISGDLSVNLHVDRFHRVTLSSECRPGGSHFGCRPIFEVQTIEVAVLTAYIVFLSFRHSMSHELTTNWPESTQVVKSELCKAL